MAVRRQIKMLGPTRAWVKNVIGAEGGIRHQEREVD